MKTNNLNTNVVELNSLVAELQHENNQLDAEIAELEQHCNDIQNEHDLECLMYDAIIEDKDRLIKELQAHIRELDTYEVRELALHERRGCVS